MRWVRLLVLLALLLSCGGGGDAPAGPCASALFQPRVDRVLYGYYGDDANSLTETADHVAFDFIFCWGDNVTPEGLAACAAFRSTGLGMVIAVQALAYSGGREHPALAANMRTLFSHLRAYGVLGHVLALYPIDEPNGAVDAATVTAVNLGIKAVMAEFVELKDAKLAVIYGSSLERGIVGGTVGLASYDWIGLDDYAGGVAALCGELAGLRSQLTPAQRLLLVPGGADPWRADPEPWYTAAQDPKVIALVPFLWIDGTGRAGIRSNGMASAYRAIGLRIKNAP